MSYSAGLIFILSGPSGSGKTTLRKKVILRKGLRGKLTKVASFTTRPARQSEKHGRDYFFVSREEFFKRKARGEFLEWTKYLRHYYATPKYPIQKILKQDKAVVLCLDTKGALGIKRLYPHNVILIFILPPTLAVLKARLKKRTKAKLRGELTRRLDIIHDEIYHAQKYDYLLTNDSLSESLKLLSAIILVEGHKTERMRNALRSFRETLR